MNDNQPAPAAPRLHLFQAKMHPPRGVRQAVDRLHLVAHMRAALPSGLLLVTAPAGFGKTTLLCQMHAQTRNAGVPSAWVSLERADNELGRFVAYVYAAMAPVLRDGRAAGSTDGAMTVDSPLTLVMELVEAIAAREQPFTLFLDDVHEIDDPDVFDFLGRLLSVLREGQLLVVGTRELPALDIHRMRAYGAALEIDARSLRFTLAETREFLCLGQLAPMSEADSLYLYERTEGWPTALQLAALALAGSAKRPQALLEGAQSTAQIADYLAAEVFARQSPLVQDFLLKISILPTFNVELCTAVSDCADSWAMLHHIDHANLFLTPLDEEREWYRFHQMFAEFLRGQLERRVPGQAADLHRRAANWLLDNGRPGRAVEHALQTGDTALTAMLMDVCAAELVAHGRQATLLRWMASIPEADLVRFPELHSSCILALITVHRHAQARVMIEQYLAGDSAPNPIREADMISQRVFLALWSDRLDELPARLVTALRDKSLYPAFRLGTVLNCQAYQLVLQGDFTAAREQFLTARGLLEQSGGSLSKSYSDSGAGIAMVDLLQGRFLAVAAYLERSIESWEPYSERFCLSNTMAAALLAEARYEKRDFTASRELLDICMPLIRQSTIPEGLICALRLRARIAGRDGELNLANQMLDDLEALAVQRELPRAQASVWLERSRMALLAGDVTAAERHHVQAAAFPFWETGPYRCTYANDIETPELAAVRLLLASGKGEQAVAALPPLIAAAQAQGRVVRAIHLQGLHAQALWLAGSSVESLAVMREALRRAAPEQMLQTFVDEPWVLSELLRQLALEPDSVPAEFLRELLAACDVSAGARSGAATVSQGAGTAASESVAGVLSRREVEVLGMVATGLSNKQIARTLFRSETTIATHLRNIYAKLGANGRVQAMVIAREQGLIG